MATTDDGDSAREAILQAALDYAARGWRVVPTDKNEKHPKLKEWQKLATTDETQIEKWWNSKQFRDANVCVAMGPSSGIVDFETDSEQGEENLLELFGGDVPVTATFQSSRGKHRLFKYRNDLPEKAHYLWDGLDFKLGYDDRGSQSTFPPSIHVSCRRYEWLPSLSPDDCDIAAIPDRVVASLHNIAGMDLAAAGKPSKDWGKIRAEGVGEGERNQAMAAYSGKVVRDLVDVFDRSAASRALDAVLMFNTRCRPPLDEREVETTFSSILSAERLKRANSNANSVFEKDLPDGPPAKWAMYVVESRPRKYLVESPLWLHAPGGCVELDSSKKVQCGDAVCDAAMEQADVWLDRNQFKKDWNGDARTGKPSLGKQLFMSAIHIPAEPEERRDVVVAEAVLGYLEGAKQGDKADPRGRAVRKDNGETWVQVKAILDAVGFGPAKIEYGEIVETLKKAGATNGAEKIGGSARRFKVLKSKNLQKLRKLAESPEDSIAPATILGDEKNVLPF